MSLKSFFNAVVQPVARFLENQEIQSLESRKVNAQAGFMHIPTRVGGVIFSLEPDAAKGIVQTCDARLAEIHKKRELGLK